MQQNPPVAKKSNTLVIVLVIAGIAIFAIVAIVGVLAALGIFGVRKYLSQAKSAEGRAQVHALARGIVACAEQNRDLGKTELLPATAPAVPATLGEVSGKKYMSSPADWSDPAYSCASFSIGHPQYFQYQWRRSGNDHGVAIATADLDGNGAPDASFELPVTCSGTSCSVGTLIEK
jgi:type IV pilus assembly protein PilA